MDKNGGSFLLKKTLLIINFILLGLLLNAQSQKVYTLSMYETLYNYIEDIHLDVGSSLLSSVMPYTGNEILNILEQIDYTKLHGQSKEKYNYIMHIVKPINNTKGFTPEFDLILNTEYYGNTNSNNDYFIYDYYDRKPVVNVDLGFDVYNTFWSSLSIPLQKGYDISTFTSDNSSNISLIWNIDEFDLQFPYRAISSFGGNHWNIQLGRDKLRYGLGNTSTFVLTDATSFHDYFKISTYWDKFKYTFTLVQLECANIGDLLTYDTVYTDGIIGVQRNLLVHSLEFKPINPMSISITEVSLRAGDLNISYINPFSVLHNLAYTDYAIYDYTMGNSLLSLGINFTPFKNASIYTEGVVDQFELPMETSHMENSDSRDPNAFGFLAGINYQINFPSLAIKLNAEYAYTNPHLYRSDSSWAIYAITRYYHSEYLYNNDVIVENLGYEYGPDIKLFKFSAQTELFENKLSLYIEYINILKGESSLEDVAETGTQAFYELTPSGNIIFKRNIITLKINYSVTPNFSIYSQINELFIINDNNVNGDDYSDFQFVIGCSYKI